MTVQQLMGLGSLLVLLGFVAFAFRGSSTIKDDGDGTAGRGPDVGTPAGSD
jgi:hypothetical protein